MNDDRTQGSAWLSRMHARLLARLDERCERAVSSRKRAMLEQLRGHVLEIGVGPAVNLHYYAPGVVWSGVEPNLSFHPTIEAEAKRLGMQIDLRRVLPSRLDAEDASMDAVVSMFALCTVANPVQMLAEIRRVLKPNGIFVFMEHVAAPPKTALRFVQHLSRPLWVRFAEGCLPDADTLPRIRQAGFARVEHDAFTIPVPLISPHIAGVARMTR